MSPVTLNKPETCCTVKSAPIAEATERTLAADELAQLHNDDKNAAAFIVIIMGCIFTVGVVMYTVIAFLAAGGQ